MSTQSSQLDSVWNQMVQLSYPYVVEESFTYNLLNVHVDDIRSKSPHTLSYTSSSWDFIFMSWISHILARRKQQLILIMWISTSLLAAMGIARICRGRAARSDCERCYMLAYSFALFSLRSAFILMFIYSPCHGMSCRRVSFRLCVDDDSWGPGESRAHAGEMNANMTHDLFFMAQ